MICCWLLESTKETVVAGISQEHLAQMVGTTRSRINYFMNRFRKLGFIDYKGEEGVTVHRGLLNFARDDEPEPRPRGRNGQPPADGIFFGP